MNDSKILTKDEAAESEPLTADALIANLLNDLLVDNGVDEAANEFINEFVLQDRDETTQILGMLEMPSESLIDLLKGFVNESYRVHISALDTKGVRFINDLKFAVKEKMTALANANT